MIGARLWPALLAAASCQLCIREPSTLRSRFPGGCLWGSTAAFASPIYADRIRGRLLWERGPGCTPQVGGRQGGPDFGNGTVAEPARDDEAFDAILMVRIGQCSFAQKARSAYWRGSQALVVVDSADSQASGGEVRRLAIGGDGGRPSDLVPVLFLGREAEPVVELASSGEAVEVELRWDLQFPVAKLDLWLSAYEPTALALLGDLAPLARALGRALVFRPHYHVEAVAEGTPRSVVARDCLHSMPQFCTEGDGGIDGAAMLQEAMRQHCLIVSNGTGDETGYPAAWWAYAELLRLACPEGSSSASCSSGVLAGSGADVAAVERCISEQGLAFLEDDRESGAWWSPSQVVVRINDGRYSGPLSVVSVSRAICRRFDTLPEACAAFAPAVEEAPEGIVLPLWVLAGLCAATFLASSAAICFAAWCASRCRRVRQKCA